MRLASVINNFRKRCEFLQRMTLDFAKDVPDEHWEFSPQERFAPFCQQLRHIVCVRGFETPLLAHTSGGV